MPPAARSRTYARNGPLQRARLASSPRPAAASSSSSFVRPARRSRLNLSLTPLPTIAPPPSDPLKRRPPLPPSHRRRQSRLRPPRLCPFRRRPPPLPRRPPSSAHPSRSGPTRQLPPGARAVRLLSRTRRLSVVVRCHQVPPSLSRERSRASSLPSQNQRGLLQSVKLRRPRLFAHRSGAVLPAAAVGGRHPRPPSHHWPSTHPPRPGRRPRARPPSNSYSSLRSLRRSSPARRAA
jgi:hypothetical protein